MKLHCKKNLQNSQRFLLCFFFSVTLSSVSGSPAENKKKQTEEWEFDVSGKGEMTHNET